jgi:Fic family protein
MSAAYIQRSRNEVIQHARAFQHIIHAFVVEKKDLSEDLIKETHRVLVKGVPIVEEGFPDVSPEVYGGIYRTVVVGAGTTNFTVPQFVPKKMKDMCDALKEELQVAEDRQEIDPFSIASKYSLEFVQIHPFQDGNGRMCRMILNAILCRYAGVVVPIGEDEEERGFYMGIKRRSSQNMEGHAEYAAFVLEKALPRLRQMKKKLMGKRGKEVVKG